MITDNVFTDRLMCEAYVCFNTVYPNCNHSYTSCPSLSPDHKFMFVCVSSYSYTNAGYLVPVYKGCTVIFKSVVVEEESCHIHNPLEAAEGIYSCYCVGDYCNQNDTFTHVIRLISYGKLYAFNYMYGKRYNYMNLFKQASLRIFRLSFAYFCRRRKGM